jgi:hypothetical protein
MDYWDLAKFYIEQKYEKKGVMSAEEGLTKGKGRIIELLIYLSEYYCKIKDLENLKRIVEVAKQKDQAITETLSKLFTYYTENEDYENTKATLVESFLKELKI